MAFSAGQVSAILEGKFSPAGFVAFGGAMNKAKAEMMAMEKSVAGSSDRTGKGMAVMGVAAKGAAVGIGGLAVVVGLSVKKAAEFEAQLSSLKSVTGASADEMAKLKKSAMDAGAATKFSALDAAKAQTELAKGGLNTAKILGGGLKAALSLAAAGEMELADAASTTANALNLFGINASEAERVADALATAANNTTADVGHFAMALTQGGAAAKAAGLSFDQTVVALEALAANSVKGSDAGTSLKAALTQIANPTDEAARAAKSLGLNFFDAQGNMRPLPAIAANLDKSFAGLTRQQQLAAASTIAGTDGMRVLLALYDSSPEKLRAYAAGLEEQGTAARVAAEKQDNLQGKIENLKGSIETAMIALGGPLLEPLTDGAIEATKVINDMAASGDLEGFGKALGDSLRVGAEGFRVFVDVMQVAVQAVKGGLDGFLGTISTVLDALVTAGKVANKLNPFGDVVDTGELERAAARINKFREGLRGGRTEIKVTANVDQATSALKKIQGTKLEPKVSKILADDGDARSKIKRLIALGIPRKDAKVIADVAQALGGINSVRGALAALPAFKQVTIQVNRIARGEIKVPNLSPTPRRAQGIKTTGPELALIGEGSDPVEWVIPRDRKYRGRAVGLLMDAAAEILPGYAKGTKTGAKKKTAAAKRKPLFVPQRIAQGGVPFEDVEQDYKAKRETYQGANRELGSAQEKLDKAETRLSRVPSGKAYDARRKTASTALADARKERNAAKRRAARLRPAFTKAERYWREAKKTDDRSKELQTQINLARDDMADASRTGNVNAHSEARSRRQSTIKDLIKLLQRSLRLANPNSAHARALREQLSALGGRAAVAGQAAGFGGEFAEAGADEVPAEAAAAVAETEADRIFDTGLTDAERKRLQDIEAGVALAALTAPLDDDRAAAGALAGFFESVLGAAMADPARGGSPTIAEFAGRLKQARDNLASLTGAGAGGTQNENANLQAQINQERERRIAAERDRDINAGALSVFRTSGDIAYGQPTINVYSQSLIPGGPREQAQIAGAVTGAIGTQPYSSPPRERAGG